MSKKLNKFKVCGDYSIIYIERNGDTIEVIVDTEDLEKIISVGSWHAIPSKTLYQGVSYYMCHRYNNKTMGAGCIKLHRFIMDCPRDKVIDHINHNTLDNRKCNLKVCSLFENQQNLRSRTSKLTGVYKRHRYNKDFWVATISKDNKRYSKDFKTEEKAYKWRIDKVKELYGMEVVPR